MTARALVVVDVQNDFCEGGSLAVDGGAQVAARVRAHVESHLADYVAVVATTDWHVDPGDHFSATPDFVRSWPPHCVVGTPGADVHPAFAPALPHVAALFRKGEYSAAYSGFEGATTTDDGAVVALGDWLRAHGVTDVDVVGIATDHCVRATALDAAASGFDVRVMTGLTAGVAPTSTAAALEELRAAGVQTLP